MSYQPSPRQIERQRRFDEIRAALQPLGVSLIVGDGFRGFSGRCLRLRYLRDDYGSPAGYRVRLDDIQRADGQTSYRSTEPVQVRSQEIWIDDQPNKLGQPGAVCMLPDPQAIVQAAEQLLQRPVFGESQVV